MRPSQAQAAPAPAAVPAQPQAAPPPARRRAGAAHGSRLGAALIMLSALALALCSSLLLSAVPFASAAATSSSGMGSGGGLLFNVSSPAVCRPMNVTFAPTSRGFPYVVWVNALYSAAQSFRIDADYARNADGTITFQYVVPPASARFAAFSVSVADALGNGNTSRPLSPYVPDGGNQDCDPYTAGTAFLWAGDSQVGAVNNMVQCGDVKFYTLDNRGTRPYTITFLPSQDVPLTVTVPSSATANETFFNYTLPLPYAAGTTLAIVVGDASGGASGGTSQLYTVGDSSDSSCLRNAQAQKLGTALPLNGITASFQNIPGAVTDASNTPTDGGSGSGSGTGSGAAAGGSSGSGRGRSSGSNTGAIVGGIVGAVIALGIVLALGVAYFLWKRRQRRLREAARKEEDHFVDLDGDEDMQEAPGAAGGFLRAKRASAGIRQSYGVSPFPYDPAHAATASGASVAANSSAQHHASAPAAAAAATAAVAVPAAAAAPAVAGALSRQHTTSTQFASYAGSGAAAPAPTASPPPPSAGATAASFTRSASPPAPPRSPFQGAGAYSYGHAHGHGHSRAHSRSNSQGSFAGAGVFPGLAGLAAPVPRGPLRALNADRAGEEEEEDDDEEEKEETASGSTSTSAAAGARLLLHRDAGPVPADPSDATAADGADKQLVEELPPQYGGWAKEAARMASMRIAQAKGRGKEGA